MTREPAVKINPNNLPPDMTAPPPDARGWLAFQPSSGKIWWKLNGEWLPIAKARALIESRNSK
ncbi:hypothetical protein ACVW1A_006810 [Bradyrhizobium sp. LB1.3]